MREVVFVDAARTEFGKMGGLLKHLSSTELAAHAIRGLVEKTGILEKGGLDGVYMGNALRDSKTNLMARYATLLAGLPVEVESHYVEMQCGSAITAINHAAGQIALGYADVLIVGGAESYSTLVAYYSMSNEPYKLIPPTPLTMRLAPTDEENIDMSHVSDKMAARWGITREQCDEFAYTSQMRLADAYRNGITGEEIIPYVIPATRKTPQVICDKDEFPKPNTTLEGLANLAPVVPGGVTTAGNASGRNDGAAFLLMMSADKARELGYTPYARWVSGADIGVQPSLMGIGPAYSNLKALKMAGLQIKDLDVFECNEAFAAQNLSVIQEMEQQSGQPIDRDKWNPNGGAIAIGHPNGASGARIGWFAMKQLEKTGGKYGLFSSCCGGGHGTTTVIENLRR